MARRPTAYIRSRKGTQVQNPAGEFVAPPVQLISVQHDDADSIYFVSLIFNGNVLTAGGADTGIQNFSNGDASINTYGGDTPDQAFAEFNLPVLENHLIGWNTPPATITDDATAGPVSRNARIGVVGRYGGPPTDINVIAVTLVDNNTYLIEFDSPAVAVTSVGEWTVKDSVTGLWWAATEQTLAPADKVQIIVPGLVNAGDEYSISVGDGGVVFETDGPLGLPQNGSI